MMMVRFDGPSAVIASMREDDDRDGQERVDDPAQDVVDGARGSTR